MKGLKASLLCDFYKLGHRIMYPKGTASVYSTWTPRESRIPGVDKVVVFGLQAFLQEWLVEFFDEYFFSKPEEQVVAEHNRIVKHTLGIENPDAEHIRALHRLGYLPLHIKALHEGTVAPLRVPVLTVENTVPEFFWLTNYIESMMSAELWKRSTVATIAKEYRRIIDYWAMITGADPGFSQWQGHDFSLRGMSGVCDAALSGMGHLLSFTGTDTIPAINALEEFYGANVEQELVGGSVYASEHSVMCAGGPEGELDTYRYLLTEAVPSGILSVVSDTYDLWNVLGNILPQLKETILAREGKLVIRPDSGDPVLILCGDPDAENPLARKGVIECLWDLFGGTYTENGYKQLDPHIGAIYGDSITLQRAQDILSRLALKQFASSNVVLGIGSFTYQYITRDTFGWAMKATSVVVNGEERQIFKDPATDTKKTKKSQRGRVAVTQDKDGVIAYVDGLSVQAQIAMAEIDLLKPVYLNGKILRAHTLAEIRGRLQSAR